MNNPPDVIGMKIPAAVEILDAAGISHNELIIRPLKAGRPNDADEQAMEKWPLRVIRQTCDDNGNVMLTLCRIADEAEHML